MPAAVWVPAAVVQTRDGALRLVLNSSQSQRTLSARFLADFFGSGVQHLAFATDDIFATGQELQRTVRGVTGEAQRLIVGVPGFADEGLGHGAKFYTPGTCLPPPTP